MAVNALGGSVFDIAIAVLVLQQTGSVMAMGSIVIMESIPTIFPGILIGAVVDRNAPRRMIGVGYGGQAIIVGLTAVALLLTGTTSLIVIAPRWCSFGCPLTCSPAPARSRPCHRCTANQPVVQFTVSADVDLNLHRRTRRRRNPWQPPSARYGSSPPTRCRSP